MRILILTLLLLPTTLRAGNPHRWYIGLVELPLLDHGQCGNVAKRDARIAVYAEPSSDAKRIASIRLQDNNPRYSGNCLGPFVEGRGWLPLDEYGYEEAGAIVIGERKGWWQVRLDRGAGWIRKRDLGDMHWYDAMVMNSIAWMVPEWDGRLYAKPGGASKRWTKRNERNQVDIEVKDVREAGDRLWFEVEILSDSVCAGHPKVIGRGWVRGYTRDGLPTIDFASRGC